MKKVLALLIVCALVAPAFAGEVTLSSVDNEDGTATVSMTVVSGDPVGIGLDVTTTSGELDDVVMAVDSFFDIFVDAAYDMETAAAGSYTYGAGVGPVCLVGGPGSTTVAAANAAVTPFALCVGGLGGAANPLTAGPTTGDTVELFVFSASVDTTAEVTLNVIRGGIVDKDATAMTVNGLPLTVTITNPPVGPACWSFATQCYGDLDGGGAINTGDFFPFKDAYNTSYFANTMGTALGEYNPCADLNQDGYINTTDFFTFKDNYNTSPPADCAVGGVWPPTP